MHRAVGFPFSGEPTAHAYWLRSSQVNRCATTLRLAFIALFVLATHAHAQLRVVTYNTLDNPATAGDLALVADVITAIGGTSRNGIAKRPDIIALQEQRAYSITDSTAKRIADELNTAYGVTSYQAEMQGFSADSLAFVYDAATVELLDIRSVLTGGIRNGYRSHFRPVGYDDPAAELYLYNAHLKAGSSSSDRSARATEAGAIRSNADNLGAGTNVLYLGDLNFGSYTEQGYANLLASGNGQASDPLDLATWPNFGVAEHMTQSTRSTVLSDGGASGGMDDRFDIQLTTASLLDGEGLSYIGPTSAGLGSMEHSYNALGNDGVSWNTRINNTYAGRSQSASVLDALHGFSDHLPVVADYQLPAVLEVATASIPSTLNLDEQFDLQVLVRNAADVVAQAGADELDWTLTVSGDLLGGASGVELALEAAAAATIQFDTSVAGLRSGTLTVSSNSQAAENPSFILPISYEVLDLALAGDFNGDDQVDALDYAVWREGYARGLYDTDAFTEWLNNFGAVTPAAAPPVSVPEPGAAVASLAGLFVLLTTGARPRRSIGSHTSDRRRASWMSNNGNETAPRLHRRLICGVYTH